MIIEIHDPEVEAKIKAQAEARGISVEALIASMVEGPNGVQIGEVEAADLALAGDDEFIQALESMAADVTPLPRDYSREEIYCPLLGGLKPSPLGDGFS
ncbi:MAG: hypothetical protein MOB07_27885 [Acidobacteria bacterium]|nr:hypothetical protein [Acidobacteriota bacterium]